MQDFVETKLTQLVWQPTALSKFNKSASLRASRALRTVRADPVTYNIVSGGDDVTGPAERKSWWEHEWRQSVRKLVAGLSR